MTHDNALTNATLRLSVEHAVDDALADDIDDTEVGLAELNCYRGVANTFKIIGAFMACGLLAAVLMGCDTRVHNFDVVAYDRCHEECNGPALYADVGDWGARAVTCHCAGGLIATLPPRRGQ